MSTPAELERILEAEAAEFAATGVSLSAGLATTPAQLAALRAAVVAHRNNSDIGTGPRPTNPQDGAGMRAKRAQARADAKREANRQNNVESKKISPVVIHAIIFVVNVVIVWGLSYVFYELFPDAKLNELFVIALIVVSIGLAVKIVWKMKEKFYGSLIIVGYTIFAIIMGINYTFGPSILIFTMIGSLIIGNKYLFI